MKICNFFFFVKVVLISVLLQLEDFFLFDNDKQYESVQWLDVVVILFWTI